MPNLILYGVDEHAKTILPSLRKRGLSPECFCDSEGERRSREYLGLPVLSPAQVKGAFPDYQVYVTLPEPAVYQTIARLVGENIFEKGRIANEIKECYCSCEFLEQGLVAFSEGLKHCCGDLSDAHFNSLPMVPYSDEVMRETDQFLTRFIEQKKRIISDNRAGRQTCCTGCSYLKNGYWHTAKKIRQLNFSIDDTCNLKCGYCFKADADYRLKRSVNIVELIKRVKACPSVSVEMPVFYACGEITIQPDADEILGQLQEYEVAFFSNATGYNATLHTMIKRPLSSVVISLDCGTRETYRRIKGQDLFDRVCGNIAAYSKGGGNVMLKYIVTEENANRNDLNGFIDICEKSGVSHIRIARDWRYTSIDSVSDRIRNAAVRLAYKAAKHNIKCHADGATVCS